MTSAQKNANDAKKWRHLELLARQARLMTGTALDKNALVDTLGSLPGQRVRFERLPDGRIAVEFGV